MQSIFAHSHVLLVHGPIAIVLALALVEGWFRVRKRPAPVDAARALLVLSVAAAAVSVASGLVYDSIEEFHGKTARTLEIHESVGIGALVWITVALALHVLWQRRGSRPLGGAYAAALLVSCALVSITGHLGGTMVHGEGYLTKSAGDAAVDEGPIAASDGDEGGATVARDRVKDDPSILTRGDRIDYARDVQPIFQRSCLKCHGAEKRKGKLRLDKKKYAMHGGEAGDDIVPGDPDASLLIKLVSLPADDEDVMPEKGKLLSASEIEVLRRWIKEGAHWPDDGE